MLVVFSGLPGTGKTSVARQAARLAPAVHLRIDTIEQALRPHLSSSAAGVGPAGYLAAYGLARDNLALGLAVIADCVNPVAATRQAWQAVARDLSVRLLQVELVCSDADEHRRRVQTRPSDIAGFTPPSWPAVLAHAYQPWTEARLVIDTARLDVAQAAQTVLAVMRRPV